MKQKTKGVSLKEHLISVTSGDEVNNVNVAAERPSYVIFALFALAFSGAFAVYYYQFEVLPPPLALEQAGDGDVKFSENEARKHVEALTRLGPHPVGSDALETAVEYINEVAETIKKTARNEVEVEVDLFHAKSGANNQLGGMFEGKTLAYSDLNYVVLRIKPKYASEAGEYASGAEENAVLVSAHVDTVFAAEGAGDDTSNVAVMLELARGLSQSASGFKNSVIFLFNTGEEEGLSGAHSFITQHPWSQTLKIAIDLEAMGIGGKSGIFQAGPNPFAINNFASAAKYPSAQIASEDLFSSGVINSGTDFQVYKEIGGLSGLDFAYTDHTAVYHTKNDKFGLLKPGSLQHLGDNMLPFLLQVASSPTLSKGKTLESDVEYDKAIYFDILGTYMVNFRQSFGSMLYNLVILQAIILFAASVIMGGYPVAVSSVLSFLSIILMWICSISFSAVVAFILPHISSSPVPFISSPWLAVGLFGSPALLGAFIGQHLGYQILESYFSLTVVGSKRNLSASLRGSVAKIDAERWLFKAGLLQWLVLLIAGNYYKIGSTYLAFVWLVSPALAYGLFEATLSPARLPEPLKLVTSITGLFLPFLLTSGIAIHLSDVLIGNTVRMVRNPGTSPEWMGSVIVAILIAAIVCLTLVHLLAYTHNSDAKVPIIIATSGLLVISLAAVYTGIVPPFTEDTSRAVNVVHVVDATGTSAGKTEPVSYISLFSGTPGNLNKEAEEIGEGFVCGTDRHIDFVTFSVNYGCWTDKTAETGWLKSGMHQMLVERDTKGERRETNISIDTQISTRWSLGINTGVIEDFQLTDTNSSKVLIPLGEKSSVDGWHIVQFSGGKNSPTKFTLSLLWAQDDTRTTSEDENILLKLRTDVKLVTPPVKTILEKLPRWCSLIGKSSSPNTLAFLSSLPVSLT